MDRRERYRNDEEVLRLAMRALQARLWTTLPGRVESFNAAQMTVEVQPTINGIVRKKDGTFISLTMPRLLDCPVEWQGGGGATFTFPIKPGDECVVHFSARCIDAWWKLGWKAAAAGQASNPAMDPPSLRMHSLSDGFALVGLRSLPRAFPVDQNNASLQSDDGATYVRLNPTARTVTVLAPGGINLNGVAIDSAGNVVTSGDVTSKGKVLATHTHTDPQGSVTGPPV